MFEGCSWLHDWPWHLAIMCVCNMLGRVDFVGLSVFSCSGLYKGVCNDHYAIYGTRLWRRTVEPRARKQGYRSKAGTRTGHGTIITKDWLRHAEYLIVESKNNNYSRSFNLIMLHQRIIESIHLTRVYAKCYMIIEGWVYSNESPLCAGIVINTPSIPQSDQWLVYRAITTD